MYAIIQYSHIDVFSTVSKEDLENRALSSRVRLQKKIDTTSSSPSTDEEKHESEVYSSAEEILPAKKRKV